eukprot:scaffold736_cov254-Pinguiococcus_pyrenoidosus.AAC.2
MEVAVSALAFCCFTSSYPATRRPPPTVLLHLPRLLPLSTHESNQGEELGSRPRIRLEAASYRGGDGGRARLVNAPHAHAKVLRLDDNANTQRVDCLLDRLADLLRQALLHLQPPCVHLGHPRELAEAQDVGPRNVGNVHLPREGHQMVLAQGVQVNVLDQDHLRVAFVEHGVAHHLRQALLIALGEKPHGFGRSHGRLDQSFPLRVLAQALQDHPEGRCHLLELLGLLAGRLGPLETQRRQIRPPLQGPRLHPRVAAGALIRRGLDRVLLKILAGTEVSLWRNASMRFLQNFARPQGGPPPGERASLTTSLPTAAESTSRAGGDRAPSTLVAT